MDQNKTLQTLSKEFEEPEKLVEKKLKLVRIHGMAL
jgi:hypothetical protein